MQAQTDYPQSESAMRNPRTVIFTDLDHTLLDTAGGLGIAAPFIRRLQSRGIPVIPTTSKTALEVMSLWRYWRLHGPAVVENGAALCLPQTPRGWRIQRLTSWRYSQIRAIVCGLRQTLGLPLEGFGDWSLKTLCRMTGLSPIKALAARTRLASEPLKWDGPVDSRMLESLSKLGLTAAPGGRFLTLQPTGIDKARGAIELLNHFKVGGKRPRVIALGDAPNDRRLLEMADHAVCMPGPNALPERLPCLRIRNSGPAGWIEAITHMGLR